MRVERMGSVMVLAAALAAAGCGGSNTPSSTADAGAGIDSGAGTDAGAGIDSGAGTDGGTGIDSGAGTDAGAGGSLATPVTVTMAMGTSSTKIGASICQLTLFGPPIGYELDAESPSGDCPGGQPAYMSFFLDTGTGQYSAWAVDDVDSSGNPAGPVTFTSTTESSIIMHSGSPDSRDRVIMLTEGAPITIVTNDRTVTFQFSGNDVTVSAFTAL